MTLRSLALSNVLMLPKRAERSFDGIDLLDAMGVAGTGGGGGGRHELLTAPVF